MMMINSPTLSSECDKHLRFSKARPADETLSVSSASVEQTFDDINNNSYEPEKTSIDCTNAIRSDISSSNDNENDTTLLTTTTTTTTVEVKVKTTKTSSRKRKLNVINDMNINQQQAVTKKKKKQRVTKTEDELAAISNNSKKKNQSKTVEQSSITDEAAFGSCEPGSNIVLQGIVWNETDKGVLVVNITWRGKTYVGALLNTTEQNWAPPRYRADTRPTKSNPTRDHQLLSIPPSNESSERILRNGKRRGSSTTVIPSSTAKANSFKIPSTPPLKTDETSMIIDKSLESSSVNLPDEETGDNCSSRSVSPMTSGSSTTSSSPPLTNTLESQSSSTTLPIDLSNSKPTSKSTTFHFPTEILHSSDYFPSLHGSTSSFNIPSFNKLSAASSTVSSSSPYLPLPPQLYFNPLTTSHYPSCSSLSKASR